MNRYDTYKPSGIEWLGEIPEHWEVKRLKNIAGVNEAVLPESTPFNYLLKYIDISNVNDKGDIIDIQEFEFSEAPSRSRRKVKDGDVIISTVRTYLKAIAYLNKPEENLIVSTGFAVLTARKNTIHPKFLSYQVSNDIFIQEVIANSEGVSYPAISSTKLADLKVFVPPLPEQHTIASYLDEQTHKIDKLIANKKAQVGRLRELRQIEINNAVTKGINPNAPLKDSGIEWLGEIPGHWRVKRLKDILIDLKSGEGFSANDLEDEAAFEVFGGNGVLGYINKFNFDGRAIVIGRVGAKCGNINIIEGKKWISDNALFCYTHQHYEFVYYLLEAMNLNQYSNQNAQPLITGTIVRYLKFALPPKEEQLQIANRLQQRTDTFDKLIKNTESQILKLQELRKIKIYEAVTGKLRIENGK